MLAPSTAPCILAPRLGWGKALVFGPCVQGDESPPPASPRQEGVETASKV